MMSVLSQVVLENSHSGLQKTTKPLGLQKWKKLATGACIKETKEKAIEAYRLKKSHSGLLNKTCSHVRLAGAAATLDLKHVEGQLFLPRPFCLYPKPL